MVLGLRESQRAGDTGASRPIAVNAAIGYAVHEFLAWEAYLLDHHRYGEWTTLLSRDLRYRSPVELFAQLPDEPQITPVDSHSVKDYNFILTRVRELQGRLATARTSDTSISVHRLITNVMVSPADCSWEFAVISYVLVTGAREGEPQEKILTVERRDCLRRMSDSFQIARRELRIARVPAQIRQWVGFL